MDQNHLEFDGKKYISSGRAAGLVGYTKDYVGQLARAGKLEARLVGRNWYVSEDSIRKHKLAVHYTLTKPKKSRPDELYAENTIQSKDISLADDNDTFADTKLEQSLPRGTGHEGDFARKEMIRADVRYETGESLEYTAGSYVPKLCDASDIEPSKPPQTHEASSSSSVDPGDVDLPVVVRSREVPVQRYPAPRIPVPRSSQVNRVDGIAVVTRPEGPRTERKAVVPRSRPPVAPSELRDRPSALVSQNVEVVRSSKRIPVLVALVVFALFCVWYWFVR